MLNKKTTPQEYGAGLIIIINQQFFPKYLLLHIPKITK